MAAGDEIEAFDAYRQAARAAEAAKDYPAAADQWALAADAGRRAHLPPGEHVGMLRQAGWACALVDRLDEARALYDEAITESERRCGADSVELATSLEARCSLGRRVGEGDIERLERAAAIRSAATPVDRSALATTYGRLAFAHDAGQYGPREREPYFRMRQIEQLVQCDPVDVDELVSAYRSLTRSTSGAERRHHAQTVRTLVERQPEVSAAQRVEVLAMVAEATVSGTEEWRAVVDEAVGLLLTAEVTRALCRASVAFLYLLDAPRGTGFTSGPGRAIADRLLGELAARGPVSARDAGYLVRVVASQAEAAGDDHAYLAYRKLLLGQRGGPNWQFANDEAVGVMAAYVGDLALAEQLLRGVVADRRSAFGDGHSTTRLAWRNLAALRQLQGRPEEAVAALTEAGLFDDAPVEDPFAASIAAASALGDVGARDRAVEVLERSVDAVASPPRGRPIAGDVDVHAAIRAIVGWRATSTSVVDELARFAGGGPRSTLRVPAAIVLAARLATTGDRDGARARLEALLADPMCTDGRDGPFATVAQADLDALLAGEDPPLVLWPAIPMGKEWLVRERARWLARPAG